MKPAASVCSEPGSNSPKKIERYPEGLRLLENLIPFNVSSPETGRSGVKGICFWLTSLDD